MAKDEVEKMRIGAKRLGLEKELAHHVSHRPSKAPDIIETPAASSKNSPASFQSPIETASDAMVIGRDVLSSLHLHDRRCLWAGPERGTKGVCTLRHSRPRSGTKDRSVYRYRQCWLCVERVRLVGKVATRGLWYHGS
jgi:hypothetical protein